MEVKINFIKCIDIVKAPSYPSLGPQLVKALLVVGLAVDMLMKSLYTGKLIALEKIDTLRSSRIYFSTVWEVSIKGVIEGSSLGYEQRKNNVIARCITQTIWFDMSVRRVEQRVGSKYRTDQAIIMEVMRLLM